MSITGREVHARLTGGEGDERSVSASTTARMSPAAITALGLGQLVNWGVLYYAFAVLLQPVQAELALPAWVITGAFSLALLVSAVLAPAVGRWSDRGHARAAMVLGGIGVAALLAVWSVVPGVSLCISCGRGLASAWRRPCTSPRLRL